MDLVSLTGVKECFILSSFSPVSDSPLHSVQAGVKSENPAQSERFSSGFQGVGLQLPRHQSGVASLWAINNVNIRQCRLLLSHSSQCIGAWVKVTLEYLSLCINFDTLAYPKRIPLHEILAMTFKLTLVF